MVMETRNAVSPKDVRFYTTERLREEFLLQNLFIRDGIRMVYSQIDRIITGAVVPVEPIPLAAGAELRSEYFLQRREMGVINIGGTGLMTVDGKEYQLEHMDGMYIGLGTRQVEFCSKDAGTPAKLYFNSAPAHRAYPTVLIKPQGKAEEGIVIIKEENKVELGNQKECNHRIINKYILPGQVESCQLVMGVTTLKEGSVWNTMPCHTHDRRMEVYLYFNMQENSAVMHYMGEPTQTRHIVVRNEEAIISPSWSIHSGCGTQAYSFIWGMVGENQAFDDMDHVSMEELL